MLTLQQWDTIREESRSERATAVADRLPKEEETLDSYLTTCAKSKTSLPVSYTLNHELTLDEAQPLIEKYRAGGWIVTTRIDGNGAACLTFSRTNPLRLA